MSRAAVCIVSMAALAAPALAQPSVAIDLTGVRIQNGLNQSRSSAPNTISPAVGYRYAVTGMVQGSGLVLGTMFPSPTPLATAMETLSPGSSALLNGEIYHPAGTHPVSVINESFTGGGVFVGVTVTAGATFTGGIGADNTLSFSITNVVLTPSILVGSLQFTSGAATVTRIPAIAGDANFDGAVDFFDIDPFLLALFDPAAYLTTYGYDVVYAVDVNRDGAVNFFDIDPFVDLLFP